MKILLKLLKAWKAPDGTDWAEGKVISIEANTPEEKAIVTDLLVSGTAEMHKSGTLNIEAGTSDEDVQKVIDAALKAKLDDKSFGDALATKVHELSAKDLSDEDPTFGYLPPHADGSKHTLDEVKYGMGLFCMDIAAAGAGHTPERLRKCHERRENMLNKAVADGIIDAKAAGTGLTINDGESAGAVVPPEFSTAMLNIGMEVATIRPRASQMPVGLGGITLPKAKNYDHSSDLIFGGILAYWLEENAQLTESAPKFETLRFTPHGVGALAYASDKTMRSSTPAFIGGWLLPRLAQGLTFAEERAFIWGTGAGQPLGLMNSPGKLALTIESGQTATANTIVTENIDEMIARIHIERSASTAFLFNRPELYQWLISLVRAVGTGGELARLFQRGGPGSEGATLDGYPAIDTEFAAAAGTEGDLIFTDLSQYVVADDRSGAELAQSMHLKFDYAQMAFRIIKYVDGGPVNSTYFTRNNGTVTTSSILTIAVRA